MISKKKSNVNAPLTFLSSRFFAKPKIQDKKLKSQERKKTF